MAEGVGAEVGVGRDDGVGYAEPVSVEDGDREAGREREALPELRKDWVLHSDAV